MIVDNQDLNETRARAGVIEHQCTTVQTTVRLGRTYLVREGHSIAT